METSYKAVRVQEAEVPTVESAVDDYKRSGGNLKSFGNFGLDPLRDCPELQSVRMAEFYNYHPSFAPIFSAVANNDPGPLRQSILRYIKITRRLELELQA